MFGTLWIISALVLAALQFGVGIFDLLFPAMGALLTGILSLLIPGLGDAWGFQLLIWLVSSFFFVFFLRSRLSKALTGPDPSPDAERLEHVGKKARVLEPISPGKPGRISFHGTSWNAFSLDEDIPADTFVYIMEKQGMNYLVSRKLLEEDETAMNEVEQLIQRVPHKDGDSKDGAQK